MTIDKKALRELAEKATPGPWRLSSESPTIIKQDYTHIGLGESSGVMIGSACAYDNSGFFPSDAQGKDNAALIAALGVTK